MCQKKGAVLTEHHVVEAPNENGKAPSIDLCEECHMLHERYRNYLRDECQINIDRTKNQK